MPRDYLAEIIEIVAELRGEPRERLTANVRVAHDLHIEGDADEEFLKAYARRLRVDLSIFEFARHFRGAGILPELIWRVAHGHPIRTEPPYSGPARHGRYDTTGCCAANRREIMLSSTR